MSSPTRLALSLTAAGLALLSARVLLTRSLDMTFLAWNVGLAWLALGLVRLALRWLALRRARESTAAWLPVSVLAWLFFPNTIYLVSDLAHANYGRGPMRWCDTAMVGTFGLVGAALAVACLEDVRRAVHARLGEPASWLACALVWVSAGAGVWLGRVRRWNSWDAVLDPLAVLADALAHFAHPRAHPATWATTLAYAAILAALQIGARAEHAPASRTA